MNKKANLIAVFILISICPVFSQNFTLQDSLIGQYLFSNNYLDNSPKSNHGTNYGTTFTTDRFGNANSAIVLDGVNDYVNLGNTIDVSSQTGMSVSGWFYPMGTMTVANRWVGITVGKKMDGEMGIRVGNETGKQFQSLLSSGFNSSTGSSSNACTYSSFNFNNWYHVVGVIQNNSTLLYVNGVLQSTNCGSNLSGGLLSHISSTADFRIGKAFNTNNTLKYYKGKIDEVSIYNRAIDYCEVLQLYGDSTKIIKASNAVSICAGDNATLTVTGGGNYIWSNGSNGSSIQVTPTSTTWYYVSDAVTGCEDSVLVSVGQGSVTNSSVCLGDSVLLTSSHGTSAQWNSGQVGDSIYVYPNVSQVYYTVGACADSIKVELLRINVSATDTILCSGMSTTLSVSSPGNYQWSNGMTGQSITITPNTTTTYTVVDANSGCSGQIIITINSIALRKITICKGEGRWLTTNLGGSAQWSNGESGDSIWASPLGNTYFIANTGLNCPDSILVKVNPTPVASFSLNANSGNTPLNINTTNNSTGYSSSSWYLNNNLVSALDDHSFQLDTQGFYVLTLVVENSFGCRDSVSQTIEVTTNYQPLYIYIPNAFTPNGDETNDVWLVQGTGVGEVLYCQIFNRWGGSIHIDYSWPISWDGRMNAQDVQEGVYTYVIRLKDQLGEIKQYNGLIHLYK